MPAKLFLIANVLLETAQQIRDKGLPLQDHLARYYKRFDAIATTYLVAKGKKGRGGRTKGKAVDTNSAPLLLREQNGFEILDTREQQFPRDFVLSNTPTSTYSERVMRLDPARDMRGIEDNEANDYYPPILREDNDEDA
ncbi:hypothetical protein EG327_000258 [Venturia inaequalis]|uniref:Uncharacterized protein n=1 Tax=Venturia inaequalis TaxID=5025 RepID=A0A8H3UAY8_VENIN|nr:hypothetical protein EG327_000258 [Venturia inaequalis]